MTVLIILAGVAILVLAVAVGASSIHGKKQEVEGQIEVYRAQAASGGIKAEALGAPAIPSFDSMFRFALALLLIALAVLWFGIARESSDLQETAFSIFGMNVVCDATLGLPRITDTGGSANVTLTVDGCVREPLGPYSTVWATPPPLEPRLIVGTTALLTPPTAPPAPAQSPYIASSPIFPKPYASGIRPTTIPKYAPTLNPLPALRAQVWQWLIPGTGHAEPVAVLISLDKREFISSVLVVRSTAETPWFVASLNIFGPLGVGLLGLFGSIAEMFKSASGPGTFVWPH